MKEEILTIAEGFDNPPPPNTIKTKFSIKKVKGIYILSTKYDFPKGLYIDKEAFKIKTYYIDRLISTKNIYILNSFNISSKEHQQFIKSFQVK